MTKVEIQTNILFSQNQSFLHLDMILSLLCMTCPLYCYIDLLYSHTPEFSSPVNSCFCCVKCFINLALEREEQVEAL